MRFRKHGDPLVNMRAFPVTATSHDLYALWSGMKRRCRNPESRSYPRYGGRGISVCDAWADDFWAFVRDVGDRPSAKHSLDRIDFNGNYEPGNVRWATGAEQARNKRSNRVTTPQVDLARQWYADGMRAADIARTLRCDYDALLRALNGQTWRETETPVGGTKVAQARKPPQQRKTTCEYDGCDATEIFQSGMCRKHHRWVYKVASFADHKDRKCRYCDGDIPPSKRIDTDFCSLSCKMKWHRRNAPDTRPRCSIDGCEQPNHAKGMCRTHHMRMWRHGDPLYEPKVHTPQPCSVADCDGFAAARGYCMRHYHLFVTKPKREAAGDTPF
jgi:hypothetical protein